MCGEAAGKGCPPEGLETPLPPERREAKMVPSCVRSAADVMLVMKRMHASSTFSRQKLDSRLVVYMPITESNGRKESHIFFTAGVTEPSSTSMMTSQMTTKRCPYFQPTRTGSNIRHV